MYGVLGLSIFIPAIHGVIVHGWAAQNERMSLTYFIGPGLLNGLGTAIYTARIPERWYPHRFDIYGGALSHTYGLLRAFDYWQSLEGQNGGACSQS
jgi:adiponectin receptor